MPFGRRCPTMNADGHDVPISDRDAEPDDAHGGFATRRLPPRERSMDGNMRRAWYLRAGSHAHPCSTCHRGLGAHTTETAATLPRELDLGVDSVYSEILHLTDYGVGTACSLTGGMLPDAGPYEDASGAPIIANSVVMVLDKLGTSAVMSKGITAQQLVRERDLMAHERMARPSEHRDNRVARDLYRQPRRRRSRA